MRPARRGRLLATFRQCLWRSRRGRLYVQTRRRLQRCCVAPALRRDASGLRESLINAGCRLIAVAGHLLLTCGDSGRGLAGAPRRRLLPGGDAGGGLICAARYLLLAKWRFRRCCELRGLDRQRSDQGLAAPRGGRPTSGQAAADRGGGWLTQPARSRRELSGQLLCSAGPTSRAAGMNLRSSVSSRRHTTAKPRWQLQRRKTRIGNGRGRTRLGHGTTDARSGTVHFQGWSGE